MKNCFDLLDLSPTATLEEIKTQYDLLMRVYNPERFLHPLDKSYAHHVREKLTEAYCTLVGLENWSTYAFSQEAVLPRAEPALIDWGITQQGEHLAAQVRIHTTAPLQSLKLTPNPVVEWLTVGRGERLNRAGKDVWAFEVQANTQNLEVGKRHIGEIKLDIEDVTLYVFLMVEVHPPLPPAEVHHRWLQRRVFLPCR